jgi:hypothetical protein
LVLVDGTVVGYSGCKSTRGQQARLQTQQLQILDQLCNKTDHYLSKYTTANSRINTLQTYESQDPCSQMTVLLGFQEVLSVYNIVGLHPVMSLGSRR